MFGNPSAPKKRAPLLWGEPLSTGMSPGCFIYCWLHAGTVLVCINDNRWAALFVALVWALQVIFVIMAHTTAEHVSK